MLLHANFIPERLARRRRYQRLVRLGLVGVFAFGLLALAPALGLQRLTSGQAEHLLALRRQRAALAPQVAQVKWLDGELNRLKQAREIAVATHLNDALWLDLLEEVRDRLPAGLWLTRLTVTPAPDAPRGPKPKTGPAAPSAPQTLVIEGLADSHQPISAYLTALNDSPWVATAVLVRTGRQSAPPTEPAGAEPAAADAPPAADARPPGPAPAPAAAPVDPGEGPTAFELRAVLRHELPPATLPTPASAMPPAPAGPPAVPAPAPPAERPAEGGAE